jgi:hypothetical protein
MAADYSTVPSGLGLWPSAPGIEMPVYFSVVPSEQYALGTCSEIEMLHSGTRN